jgi:Subtilase family
VPSAQALELLRAREPTSPSGYNYVYRSTAPSRDAPFEEKGPTGLTLNLVGTIGVIDGFSGDAIEGWTVERLIGQPAQLAHGDIVAGILLGDLADGFGAKPGKLLLMDVMEADGHAGSADVAALVLGLDRMTAAGAKVVNLSLAGPDHAALRRAVTETVRRGVTLVAAVGNAGPAAPPFYPAAYDGVVGVAAVDSGGKPYIYSGRGPHVDVAALGEITTMSHAAGQLVGTSYAAPHVTALLAGKWGTGVLIDDLLSRHTQDAGSPGRDQVFGVGILSSSPHDYVLASQPSK